jgi:hypothetical protein
VVVFLIGEQNMTIFGVVYPEKYRGRKWTTVDPDENGNPVYTTLTETEILEQYFGFWSTEMRKRGKGKQISHQNCIEDWVIVQWAYKSE